VAKTEIPSDSRPSIPRDTPPGVVAPTRGLVGTAVQVVILLLLLSILAGIVLVLFAVASLVSVPGQVTSGVGSQLGGVASQARSAVSDAQQALQNATDPTHPPTGLTYDNEFSLLQVWHVGDGLPGGNEYVLTLQSIKRREGANLPETALYAVIHAELRQPRETRLFGQVVRSDSDPHDIVVYKGETFRISNALYRVNWISQNENAMAAGVFRNPDSVTAPLQFDYQ
jgi:hypothetical protein